MDGQDRSNPHLTRIRDTIDVLAAAATEPDDSDDPATVAPYARLGSWAHMLGFRGHFGTKSRHFSTTLGELDASEDEILVVVGSWRFAGMGWLNDGDAALAADAAARARERRMTRAARKAA